MLIGDLEWLIVGCAFEVLMCGRCLVVSRVVGTVRISNLNVIRKGKQHFAGFNVQVHYAECVNVLQTTDNFTAVKSSFLHSERTA